MKPGFDGWTLRTQHIRYIILVSQEDEEGKERAGTPTEGVAAFVLEAN